MRLGHLSLAGSWKLSDVEPGSRAEFGGGAMGGAAAGKAAGTR